MLSSTVAHDGAILLYQQNYNEAVSFSSADARSLRDFYVVIAGSARSTWSGAGGRVIVAPFKTQSLSSKYSGSFVVDTTASERADVASTEKFDGKLAADTLRLYVGRAAADRDEAVHELTAREAALAIVDSRLPGSSLSFVRFDINQWEVSDSVVSYDIDISFWGRPAPETTPVAAIES
jgi:hypothetical protein